MTTTNSNKCSSEYKGIKFLSLVPVILISMEHISTFARFMYVHSSIRLSVCNCDCIHISHDEEFLLESYKNHSPNSGITVSKTLTERAISSARMRNHTGVRHLLHWRSIQPASQLMGQSVLSVKWKYINLATKPNQIFPFLQAATHHLELDSLFFGN